MANENGAVKPPIKLKFSLSSTAHTPDTPPPSTPQANGHHGKGKGKAIPQEQPLTPSIVLKAPKISLKTKGTPAPSTPVIKLKHSALSTAEHGPSTPAQPVAGPSTPARTVNTQTAGPSTPTTPHSGNLSQPTAASSSKSVNGSGVKRGRPKGSKTKNHKGKPLLVQPPSAIPPRLLSSGPSTPRPPPSAQLPSEAPPPAIPEPSTSITVETPVKVERRDDGDDDPLALTATPASVALDTPMHEGEGWFDSTEASTLSTMLPVKKASTWQRVKKPLHELLVKILAEVRRKDEYALFDEPVDLEAFPDYLQVIGGEDKAMDLDTMAKRNDDGYYKTIDQFEADLRALVTAAQIYNPPGTIPHGSAAKILTHGMKQIEKSRNLVRTPSPSPSRPTRSDAGTPWRGQSVASGREGTAQPTTATVAELPTNLLIPQQMLEFPPNSLVARAVGWNVNGGRKIYSRRQVRGREKFAGKWRHWTLDGSKDLTEMEEPELHFASSRSAEGATQRSQVDYKGLRKDDVWWELDLGGPMGQPPPANAAYPKPETLRRRDLTAFEWGVYPEIEAEGSVLAAKGRSKIEAWTEQLRPLRRKPAPVPNLPSNFVNVYDGQWDIHPRDVLSEMMFGDATGEAYHRSVSSFLEGAMQYGSDTRTESKADSYAGLKEHVNDEWRGAVFSSQAAQTALKAVSEMAAVRDRVKASLPLDTRQSGVLQVAKTQYARQAMKALNHPSNPFDIQPLLKVPEDFMAQCMGGRVDTAVGMKWIGEQIKRLSAETAAKSGGKRKRGDIAEEGDAKKIKLESGASTASSPLTQPPDSPQSDKVAAPAKDELSRDETLRKMRLELVALSKFYPLAALKKMSKEDAERLLPQNVRPLMSKK